MSRDLADGRCSSVDARPATRGRRRPAGTKSERAKLSIMIRTAARRRPFAQVDVFSAVPYAGNPVAVVLDAAGVSDADMVRFAAWTNLSETTFVLPATEPAADYRLRIFTTGSELPFAGHPTLGSAHAWLEAGGTPKDGRSPVQQCGIGLVTIQQGADGLAFATPPRLRSGPLQPTEFARALAILRIRPDDVMDAQWVDNGPGWMAVLLRSATAVLAVIPDPLLLAEAKIGLIGPYPAGSDVDFEVRAFHGGVEDPVTGSLNASLGQWLIESGRAPLCYVAGQGTALGRTGRVQVRSVDGQVWVGGRCNTCISGMVDL